MDKESREQEHLQLLCFILGFFFFFFFFPFFKNVTIKIRKIKSLPGPQPLIPQAPPPKRGPVGGGGGGRKGEKKKREKKPLFCFLFSQEAQESLRQWRRQLGGDGGDRRQGGQKGVGAGAQIGSPADSHPPGDGSVGGSSLVVPVQAQHALLAA